MVVSSTDDVLQTSGLLLESFVLAGVLAGRRGKHDDACLPCFGSCPSLFSFKPGRQDSTWVTM